MCTQRHTVGICHQGISRYSCFSLICLGKTAIDDQQLSAALNRCLSFFQFNRHMTVYNMRAVGIQPKFLENTINDVLLLHQTVIAVLLLGMNRLVCHKIAFKGRHLIFAEYRRLRTAPDVPDNILSLLGFLLVA